MAYVSNQWLNKGQGLRDRRYNPVGVTLELVVVDDEWCVDHQVVAEVRSVRQNGEFHTLLLRIEDVDAVVQSLIQLCGEKAKQAAVAGVLSALSSEEFVHVLARSLNGKSIELESGA